MPKGHPKKLDIKICKTCGSIYQSTSSRQKHCHSCISTGKPWSQWSLDYKKRLTRLCYMAKNRARNKKLAFNISPEYLIKLWEDQGGSCALTGQPLDLNQWGERGQVNPQAPSVDRIVPALGYVKGNVRLITYHMNIALSDFGIEEFENLIRHYRSVN